MRRRDLFTDPPQNEAVRWINVWIRLCEAAPRKKGAPPRHLVSEMNKIEK